MSNIISTSVKFVPKRDEGDGEVGGGVWVGG